MAPITLDVHQIPARTPLSLRVPTPLLERVQHYAEDRGITRTDAFLQLVERGLESGNSAPQQESLVPLEHKIDCVLELLQAAAERPGWRNQGQQEFASISRIVARACEEFPAIVRAYLFGSWARGCAGPESDVDIRIETDPALPFNLHDLVHLSKRIEQETGRPTDIVSARHLKNAALATAIEREKVLVYERKE